MKSGFFSIKNRLGLYMLGFFLILALVSSAAPTPTSAQDLFDKSNTNGAVNNNESGAVNNTGVTPSSKNDGLCSATDPWTWGYCIGSKVAEILLSISAKILELSARLFNYMIDYTLNIKNFINKVPIVYLGWSTFRDFANIGFIFMILYIAINTILGNEGYGIKKLLGKTIIAAMLINFSLFFTNVIVDTSNIFALQFYNQIVNTGSNTQDADGGISASFSKAMGLQDLFTKDGEAFAKSTENSTSQTGSNAKLWNVIMVGILGSIFLLITAFIFLAATGMFLYRSLTLIFLMILSPLAFAGGILPKTQKYAGEWWEKLFNTAFYAPVYMALLYLVASMVLGLYTNSGSQQSFAKMILGSSTESLPILLNYVILNALMCGCIIVASKMGAGGSKLAMSWGKDLGMGAAGYFGGATFGTTARVGQRFVGGASNRIAKRLEGTPFATTFAGRKTMGALRGVASSSFDARNTKIGKQVSKTLGLGEGLSGGYNQSVEATKKAISEYGKSLSGKRDASGWSAKEHFAQKHVGASLFGFIKKGHDGAGKEIMTSVIDDDAKSHNENMSEMNEYMQTLRDDPDYKTYVAIKTKKDNGKPTTPEEDKRFATAETNLKNKDIEYMEYDPSTKKFEKKTRKFIVITPGTGGAAPSVDDSLDNMQSFRTEALKYRKELQNSKKKYK